MKEEKTVKDATKVELLEAKIRAMETIISNQALLTEVNRELAERDATEKKKSEDKKSK